MKRPALSIALALGATLVMTVTAAASSIYTDSIHGTHQVLPNNTSAAAITGGRFRLNTVVNYVPEEILGSFTPWHGYVKQIDGFGGCTNQHYQVHGELRVVGVDWGTGSGTLCAELTHYRGNIWWVGCVVYS